MPKPAKSQEGKKAFEPVLEKDNEELELEKAVFGDTEGFELNLRKLDLDNYDDSDSEEVHETNIEIDQDEESQDQIMDPTQSQDSNLFFVDEGDENSEEDDGDDEEHDETDEENQESENEIADVEDAWYDSDDEKIEVSLVSSNRLRKLRNTMQDDTIKGRDYAKRLRSRFEKLYAIPQWAKPEEEKEDEENSEDELQDQEEDGEIIRANDPLADLLKHQSTYISAGNSKKLLPSGVIDIARLKDANIFARSRSAIQSLKFHPTHPLLLSSGYDRTLRLYHIDGKTNPLATSLHIRQSPFQTAQFHPDGKRVFGAGRRKYLYIWDIETGLAEKITRMYGHEDTQRSMEKFSLSPCGRYIGMIGRAGWLNVLSATTGQWITGAKVEGIIADVAWSHNGEQAIIINTAGVVWEWSSVSREFVSRWKDESGVGVTAVALSGRGNNDRYVAVGSKSGIVNIYDRQHPTVGMKLSDSEAAIYKPIAILEQLVTTISSLVFSPDGQILAMASRAKRDAFRLVHVPSFTVFRNWPTSSTPLGRVTSVTFSPGSEMLSLGNAAGSARLWTLNHYAS